MSNGLLVFGLLFLVIIVGVIARALATQWKNATTEPDKTLEKWAALVNDVAGHVQLVIVPMVKKAVSTTDTIDDKEVAVIGQATLNELRYVWSDGEIAKLADAAHVPLGSIGTWVLQQVLDHIAGQYQQPLPIPDPVTPAAVVPPHLPIPIPDADWSASTHDDVAPYPVVPPQGPTPPDRTKEEQDDIDKLNSQGG